MSLFLFQSALKDTLRTTRIVVWLFVALCVMGFGKLWVMLAPGMLTDQSYAQFTSIVVYRLVALAAAVFSASVISQDVEQRTIVYALTRPIPRAQLLLARFGAASVATILATWAITIGAGIGMQGFACFGHQAFLMDLVVAVAGSLAYCALFMFISLLVNKSLIYCLLFAFGWESFVPNLTGTLYLGSILTYLKAISLHAKPDDTTKGFIEMLAGQLGGAQITPTVAAVVLVAIIVGFTAASAWWFTHFEYTAREDAE